MHSERRWANHKLTRQAWRCGSEGSWAYRRSLQTSRYKEESSEVHRWFTACMTCVVAHEAGGGAVGESELLGAVTCARVDSFGYLAEVARGVSSLHLYLKLVQARQQELVDCPRVVGVQG